MTSRRAMIAFAAGAILAGLVVGAARLVGLDEPPAAIADVAAPEPAAPQRPDPAPRADASPQWRGHQKRARRDDVPAGILARVVSRRGAAKPACPAQPASAPASAAAATGGDVPSPPAPDCAAGSAEHAESVEIEWHAPAATP